MPNIRRTEIDGERIHLKKSFDGWRVVHPIKNEDGSMNWKNFVTGGSWWNWFKIFAVVFIILFASWSYARDIRVCKEIADEVVSNPCKWCESMTSGNAAISYPDLNLTLAEGLVIREVNYSGEGEK